MRNVINCSHKTEVVVKKKGSNSMGHRSSVPDIFSSLFFILDTAGAASWQLLFMKTNRLIENITFMPSFPVSGKCKVVSEGERHLAEVLELT